jgi:hypothetical protein
MRSALFEICPIFEKHRREKRCNPRNAHDSIEKKKMIENNSES